MKRLPLLPLTGIDLDLISKRSMVVWALMAARVMEAAIQYRSQPIDREDFFTVAMERGFRHVPDASTFIHVLGDGGGMVLFANEHLARDLDSKFDFLAEFIRTAEVVEVLMDPKGVTIITLRVARLVEGDYMAMIAMKPAWQWPSTKS